MVMRTSKKSKRSFSKVVPIISRIGLSFMKITEIQKEKVNCKGPKITNII
jgi:hypothetical protein